MVFVSRGPRRFFAAFLALAAVVAGLSGCSSSDEVSREAENPGVRICVLNTMNDKLTSNYRFAVSVDYIVKDASTREGLLKPGEQSCAEGATATGCDVSGQIEYTYGREYRLWTSFSLDNPVIGWPTGGFSLSQDFPRDDNCGNFDSVWRVDIKETKEYGPVRVCMERLPDDGWKEFVLIITDRYHVGCDTSVERDGGGE